jgi:Mrp family chromosome partitioning ATPase
VLLIDCDARRRALTREFADRVQIGLDDVLSGKAPFERALLADGLSSAALLPQRLDATDVGLADSAKLAGLIEAVRGHYDLVLLDTPPLLAVDEARVLASVADGVVLLVRWRKTAVKASEIALRQLYDVHANVIGAVLTLVDVREQQRSGEAGYHLREYKSYHAG